MTRRLPGDILAPLEAFETTVWPNETAVPRSQLLTSVSGVQGLLCMFTDAVNHELLESAPELRVVSQMAVGVDNIDLEECHRRGIRVGHTPDVLTETTADTAFALLGAVVRRLPEGEKEVREGWQPWTPFHLTGGDLYGSTLGVIGMGRIGKAVARRATGFDMKVVYTSRSLTAPHLERVDLDELLVRSDFVVITVPLKEDTRHLLGRSELALMKPDAYLVNISRGEVIDTEALVGCLRSGHLAGVGLDVTDPEPLPPDHQLLAFPNCLVVPHIGSASVRTRTRMAEVAVENLSRGLVGDAMPAEILGSG